MRDDLSVEIKREANCHRSSLLFYLCFQELKEELENIDELRFIFTSPTFITEKAKKEKENFVSHVLIVKKSLWYRVRIKLEMN